ncbi:FOLC protein, partial [Polypterus senegalus]
MMARRLRFWESSLFAAFLFRQTGGRAAKSKTCYTIRRLSTQPARLPRMDYQDAICTLNTLQTNASFLEQVKRERGQPQMQLEAMRLFLQRVGLKVEDLDRLNIIHVTGTKGKDAHYGTMPAYFRFLTLMAFHVFLQEKCPLHVCPDLTPYECEGHRLPLGLAGVHQRSNASLALQICRSWLQHRGFYGLRETEWPGRTQTLKHGPITYYLDGAHTTRSIQACVDWFRETAMLEEKTTVGSVVRVLLFNATGERDSPALLKLLVPCQFDCAVFCPNITEAVSSASADQHNYNVTVENMLTRCLDNQKSWCWLSEKEVVPRAELLLPGGLPLMTGTVHRGVESLVFPCIHSALRWITQGRDPVMDYSGKPSTLATMQPGAIAGARTLQEAAHIQVLVTGSLHLVGGVLKLLDPVLSQ